MSRRAVCELAAWMGCTGYFVLGMLALSTCALYRAGVGFCMGLWIAGVLGLPAPEVRK